MVGDEECDECRDGTIECSGSGDPATFMVGPEDPAEFFELARLIFYSRERKWAPSELLTESAVFVQAFILFAGRILRLVEEVQERERNKRKAEVGRQNGRHE